MTSQFSCRSPKLVTEVVDEGDTATHRVHYQQCSSRNLNSLDWQRRLSKVTFESKKDPRFSLVSMEGTLTSSASKNKFERDSEQLVSSEEANEGSEDEIVKAQLVPKCVMG